MKKVLILAYDFPPNKSIGGARPESWMMHFEQLGVKPYLVSRKWEEPLEKDLDVVRPTSSQVLRDGDKILVPFKPRLRDRILLKKETSLLLILRKFLTLLAKFFDLVFLPRVYKDIIREANDLITKEKIDYVIATGEPFLLFQVARKVALKNKIPWIADYRDCWTSSRVTKDLNGLDKILMKFYTSKFEKSIVNSASLITTPAPSYARDIKLIFPSKPVEVVYNGYFEEKVSEQYLNLSQEDGVLTIAYIGILYPHQKLELFLEGVNKACSRSVEKLRLIFYGLDFYPDQRKRVEDILLSDNVMVEFTPKLPYDTLIGELKKCNICLVLSENGADWLNTKIFDYLLANREIVLAENDKGILQKIISDTQSGYCFSTVTEIELYVTDKLQEFKLNRRIKAPKKAIGYSRSKQSEKLVKLILSL